MNLNEAIKVNKDNVDYFEEEGFLKCAEATKLGIEAIKYILRLRAFSLEHRQGQLPGEGSIEDPGLSDNRMQTLQESPLGREPGA